MRAGRLYESLKNPDETQLRFVAVVLELARLVKALEEQVAQRPRPVTPWSEDSAAHG